MTTPRRKYDAAFREDAVRLVLSTNRSVKQVAEEIGVKESTLGNWLHRHREHQPNAPVPFVDKGPVAWDEHQRALAENARLKAEVEFLGKVSAFFAAKQK
jgi:transposase